MPGGAPIPDDALFRLRFHKGRIELRSTWGSLCGTIILAALFVFVGYGVVGGTYTDLFVFAFLLFSGVLILLDILVQISIPLMTFDPALTIAYINVGSHLPRIKKYHGIPEFLVEPGISRGRDVWSLNVKIGDELVYLTLAKNRDSLDKLTHQLREMISKPNERVT